MCFDASDCDMTESALAETQPLIPSFACSFARPLLTPLLWLTCWNSHQFNIRPPAYGQAIRFPRLRGGACVCMFVCVFVCLCVCALTHTHARAHTHTHTRAHTRTHTLSLHVSGCVSTVLTGGLIVCTLRLAVGSSWAALMGFLSATISLVVSAQQPQRHTPHLTAHLFVSPLLLTFYMACIPRWLFFFCFTCFQTFHHVTPSRLRTE